MKEASRQGMKGARKDGGKEKRQSGYEVLTDRLFVAAQ